MHRSTRLGMILGAALLLPLAGVVGCNQAGDAGRPITAIQAEKESLETTVPYAEVYKAQRPAEAQQVDDFYAAWRGRLAKEETAAGK